MKSVLCSYVCFYNNDISLFYYVFGRVCVMWFQACFVYVCSSCSVSYVIVHNDVLYVKCSIWKFYVYVCRCLVGLCIIFVCNNHRWDVLSKWKRYFVICCCFLCFMIFRLYFLIVIARSFSSQFGLHMVPLCSKWGLE